MKIEACGSADHPGWLRLRQALWPEGVREQHLACDWARHAGCREIASDAVLENSISHAVRRALGFEETERVVFFRRKLA